MYQLIRPLLFRLDPERAHHLTLAWLRIIGNQPRLWRWLHALYRASDSAASLEVEAFGLRFKNPVGLAAGYDKNGVAVRGLGALGFGHVEVGTVTLRPQVGNPKPRVQRVVEAQGVINSMGFPNAGVDALLQMRGEWRPATRDLQFAMHIGINLGKGKDTPLERAADDYCELLRRVQRYADYITVNVSSPNTLGLRQLQARETMESLLKAVTQVRDAAVSRVPVLVKIAPDLTDAEIDDVLTAVALSGVDGIVATNTTTNRAGIPTAYAELKGGLSGAPLRQRALHVIRAIAQRTAGRLPIIGVGGIASADDALDTLRAGAWLVQVYTGMVYVGPSLVQQINQGVWRACQQAGVKNVRELVGVA